MDPKDKQKIEEMFLLAWVGEDDGQEKTGVFGIKQGITKAGFIPLVACERNKVDRAEFHAAMQEMAKKTGKKRFLVRFKFDGIEAVADGDL